MDQENPIVANSPFSDFGSCKKTPKLEQPRVLFFFVAILGSILAGALTLAGLIWVFSFKMM